MSQTKIYHCSFHLAYYSPSVVGGGRGGRGGGGVCGGEIVKEN